MDHGHQLVVSMPDADQVREALRRCPLVVVSDAVAPIPDTLRLAHVKLPALTWGEKDGTVTNSERRISRQRTFLPPLGEAKPDWWAMTQVALRWDLRRGFESTAAIFREHAALSGFENEGRRDFDISALTELSDADYDVTATPEMAIAAWCDCGEDAPVRDWRFFHCRRQSPLYRDRRAGADSCSG